MRKAWILVILLLWGCGSSSSEVIESNSSEIAQEENHNYFSDAIKEASNAANLVQSAKTSHDWQEVAHRWRKAVELMQQVPESSSNYPSAQAKQQEYLNNEKYAEIQQSKTPIAVAPEDCTVELERVSGGRSEFVYKGLVGYTTTDKLSYQDIDKELPNSNWEIRTYVQTGPNLYEEGTESIPHKTVVKVVDQNLKHEGFGDYSGVLLVQSINDSSKEFYINHKNFSPVDYWNCEPYLAVNYGPFIATLTDEAKPINRDGQLVEIGEEKRVFCDGRGGSSAPDGSLKCMLYKQYQYGYGGVEHYIQSENVTIIY